MAIFLCLLFFAPFECHSTSLATDPNTRFAVSTWAKCSIFWNTKRHGSPWSQFYPDLGGFDLWAETTQYGRGAGCDCKFLGHLHVSLNTYSIYHAWEQAVWMHYVCAKTAWSILWLACRGYYYGCAVGGCNYGGPHASRVISKNWTPCGKFWTYAFLTFAACKYAFLLCIFGYRFCIWHSWACAWTTTHKSRDSHTAGGEQVFQYVFAREHRGFFSGFSAKVRESVFQTHGCHERKTPHRERDGEREDRIEHKSSGVRQPLNYINHYIFN